MQAQVDARARAQAERRARSAAATPSRAAAGDPAPASPAAADALRAEAEAGRDDGTAAAPERGALFRDVSGGTLADAPASEAGEEQPAAGPDEPVVIVAPPPPAPASGGMDAARLLSLVEAGKEPLRTFLIRHSQDAERAFFLRSAQRLLPPERRASLTVDDFIVVVPAFTVSELTAAFQIGFLIFLPFLIIDLVVANILLALGMMMMSPTIVSLPFKLLLFVLIDGWAKLVHGLVLTYGGG
ncbi:EscR/YscR/HrcR family type III secretion system export apparatus protein [Luteimonas sp. B3_2_R+30]|uniref:EscR/YscR/HrcR family type III secretion system export apparatus protein n=1 Tax=Luteimonas salinilitoris TaxID=3237697 RepID=A0ABV4HVD6_9GAMM